MAFEPPRCRLYLWVAQTSTTGYWYDVVTSGSNAVIYVRMVDKIGLPRMAEIFVNNRQTDISSSTASERAGVHDNTFKPFNKIMLIDEQTHIPLYVGHLYDIQRKYDVSRYGNHLVLKAYDLLEELRNIMMTDRNIWWYPKKGADVTGGLPNPDGTTPNTGIIRTHGNASAGNATTPHYLNTRSGLIQKFIELANMTSNNRENGFKILLDDDDTTGGLYTSNQLERSAYLYPSNRTVSYNTQKQASSVLQAIRIISEGDGHSSTSEVSGNRGYDYYLAPNLMTPKPNGGNWTDPGDVHFNYFQRGSRPNNLPAAYGLNITYPQGSGVSREQGNKPGHSSTHNATKLMLPDFDFGDANRGVYTHIAATYNVGLNAMGNSTTVNTRADVETKEFQLLYVYNVQGGTTNGRRDFFWKGRMFDTTSSDSAYDHPVQPIEVDTSLSPNWNHTGVYMLGGTNEKHPDEEVDFHGSQENNIRETDRNKRLFGVPRKEELSGAYSFEIDADNWGVNGEAVTPSNETLLSRTERLDGTPTVAEPIDLYYTNEDNSSQIGNDVTGSGSNPTYYPMGASDSDGITKAIGWIQWLGVSSTNGTFNNNSFQGTNTETGSIPMLISTSISGENWWPAINATTGRTEKQFFTPSEILNDNPNISSFVILVGRYSGATARLNLDRNAEVWTGNPVHYTGTKRVAHVNLSNIGLEGGSNTLVDGIAEVQAARDRMRTACAATLVQGLKEVRQGTYKVIKYPYHMIDLSINTISSTGTLRTITLEQPDGTGAVDPTDFGIKQGDVIRFFGTDSTYVTETIYGYITTISTSSITVRFPQSDSSVSAAHYCRVYVPLRAGHSIRVENEPASITGNHIVQEMEFIEDLGQSVTYITSIGENTDQSTRTMPAYKASPSLEAYRRTNAVTRQMTVPPGAQTATFTGTFNWVAGYESSRLSWSGGLLQLGEGQSIQIMAGNTYSKLGNRELPTSPTDTSTGLPIAFYIYSDLEDDPRNLKVEPIYQDYVVSGSTIKSKYIESATKAKLAWVRAGIPLAEWGTIGSSSTQAAFAVKQRSDALIESGTVTNTLLKPGAQSFRSSLKIRPGAVANLDTAISSTSSTANIGAVVGTTSNTSELAGSIQHFLTTSTEIPKRYIRIDDEILGYTGKSGNDFSGVTRGELGTIATTHDVNAIIFQPQWDRISWYHEPEGTSGSQQAKNYAIVTTKGNVYMSDANVAALDGNTSVPTNPSFYITAGTTNKINIGTKVGGGTVTPSSYSTWEGHVGYNTYYLFTTLPATNIDATTGQVYYGGSLNNPPDVTLNRSLDYWRPYGDRNMSLGLYTVGQDQSDTTNEDFSDQTGPSVLSVGVKEPVISATMVDANFIKADHIQANALTAKHTITAPTFKTSANVDAINRTYSDPEGSPAGDGTWSPNTAFTGSGIQIDGSGIYGIRGGVLQWQAITSGSDNLRGKIAAGPNKSVIIDSEGVSFSEAGGHSVLSFHIDNTASGLSNYLARIYTTTVSSTKIFHLADTDDNYIVKIGTAHATLTDHKTEAIELESQVVGFLNDRTIGDYVYYKFPSSNAATTSNKYLKISGVDTAANVGGNPNQIVATLAWDSPSGNGTVTSITAGNGLSGGTITASGTIALGTPGTLTSSTSNAVTATSHTHAVTGLGGGGGTGDIDGVNVTSPIIGGGSSGTVTIGHSTAAGDKHIPAGGSSNQVLTYSSNGTAVWAASQGGLSHENPGTAGRVAYYDSTTSIEGSDKLLLNIVGTVRFTESITSASSGDYIGTRSNNWSRAYVDNVYITDILHSQNDAGANSWGDYIQLWNSIDAFHDINGDDDLITSKPILNMGRSAATNSVDSKESHRIRFGAAQYSSGTTFQVYDLGVLNTSNSGNYDGTRTSFSIMYGSATTTGGLDDDYTSNSIWKVRNDGTMEIKIQSSDPSWTVSGYGVLWAKGTALYYKSAAGGTTYNLTASGSSGTTVNNGTANAIAYYSATDTIDGPSSGIEFDPTYASNDGILRPSEGAIANNAFLGGSTQQSNAWQQVTAGQVNIGSYVSNTNWRVIYVKAPSDLTESHSFVLPKKSASQDGALLYTDVNGLTDQLTWSDNSITSTDNLMLWKPGASDGPTLQGIGQGEQFHLNLYSYDSTNGSGGESVINLHRAKSTDFTATKTATATTDEIYEIKGWGVNSSNDWTQMSAIKTVQFEAAGSTYNGSRIIMQASKKDVGIAGTTPQAENQLVLDELYAVGVGVIPSQSNNSYALVVRGHENYDGNYVNLGGKNTYYAIYTTGYGLGVAWHTSSDARLKEDVVTITGSQALTAINALNPVTYKWIDSYYSTVDSNTASQTDAGFKSTEFATVFPNSVRKSKLDLIKNDSTNAYRIGTEVDTGESKEVEDIEAIDSAVVIPYLVAAIKDLEARIKTLEG